MCVLCTKTCIAANSEQKISVRTNCARVIKRFASPAQDHLIAIQEHNLSSPTYHQTDRRARSHAAKPQDTTPRRSVRIGTVVCNLVLVVVITKKRAIKTVVLVKKASGCGRGSRTRGGLLLFGRALYISPGDLGPALKSDKAVAFERLR